jgi:hypothetical protein
MRWQKVLGLAAFAGVAATGAVIIRDQRRRRAYTPAEVRERLHARLTETPGARQPPQRSRPSPGSWWGAAADLEGIRQNRYRSPAPAPG